MRWHLGSRKYDVSTKKYKSFLCSSHWQENVDYRQCLSWIFRWWRVHNGRINILWKGNVFSFVCLSVCPGGGCPHVTTYPHAPPRPCSLQTCSNFVLETCSNLLASGWLTFDWKAFFLPPANVGCEGYVFTPVCQSFCSQGGGVACVAGSMCGREGGWVCMAEGACMVGSVHGRGVCAAGGRACVADTTRYGQWAGGTHPTGMHSCC